MVSKQISREHQKAQQEKDGQKCNAIWRGLVRSRNVTPFEGNTSKVRCDSRFVGDMLVIHGELAILLVASFSTMTVCCALSPWGIIGFWLASLSIARAICFYPLVGPIVAQYGHQRELQGDVATTSSSFSQDWGCAYWWWWWRWSQPWWLWGVSCDDYGCWCL